MFFTHWPGRSPRRPRLGIVLLMVCALLVSVAALVFDQTSLVGQFHRAHRHQAIEVDQTNGTVTFLMRSGLAGLQPKPIGSPAITTLRVYEWIDGKTIWWVEAMSPLPVAVTYGRVPPGFLQPVPLTGDPPPLRARRWYTVVVNAPQGMGMTTFSAREARQ
jgi:hypothetical protein